MKKLIVILCVLLLFLGCGLNTIKKGYKQEKNVFKDNTKNDKDKRLTVWTAYWALDTVDEELNVLQGKVKELCYFEAYYNEDGTLFYPDKLNEYVKNQMNTIKQQGIVQYLSIVNDIAKEDGTLIQKDTNLLYKLFNSEESMKRAIDAIINLVKSNDFEGIEIDFEKIRNDLKLWEKYSKFITLLNEKAVQNNLKLRVILEPSTPIEKINLPKGPCYIMMCYNLYGYGTSPGPKADKEFLGKMTELMKKVSDNRGFALATGGFDFVKKGKAIAITEKEAINIQKKYNSKIQRDKKSKALNYKYTDKDGMAHEVWYADGETLRYWVEVIRSAGEAEVSIWKLGGNETLIKIIE